MKLFMILGGLIGFAMGLVLGLVQGSAWPGIFWRASVAALLAGLAMRWWGRVWIRSLQVAREEASRPPTQPEPPAETDPARV